MSVTELSSEKFDKEIKNSEKSVLVDFWAPWCGPCKTMLPIIDGLAEKYGQTYKFCKVNIDENPELANRYGVMSIPTFIAFKDGETAGKIVGVTDSQSILKILE